MTQAANTSLQSKHFVIQRELRFRKCVLYAKGVRNKAWLAKATIYQWCAFRKGGTVDPAYMAHGMHILEFSEFQDHILSVRAGIHRYIEVLQSPCLPILYTHIHTGTLTARTAAK